MHPSQQEPVLVVGAGLSGLATALGVTLGGRDVEVFEAADLVGGAAAYSGGQVWCADNHVARREGIEGDSLDLGERYVRDIGHSHPELLDERAMLRWLTTSPGAIKHWEDVGAIRWTVIPGLADYHNEAAGAREAGRYLTNEAFLLVAGKIVSVEARHASAIRAIRNGNYTTAFAPDALDPALTPAQVIAAARPFIVQTIVAANA